MIISKHNFHSVKHTGTTRDNKIDFKINIQNIYNIKRKIHEQKFMSIAVLEIKYEKIIH